MLRRRYDAAITMFVFLRGRSVLEYCFGLRDAACAANDARVTPATGAGGPHAQCAQRSVISESIWLASKGLTMVRTRGPNVSTGASA